MCTCMHMITIHTHTHMHKDGIHAYIRTYIHTQKPEFIHVYIYTYTYHGSPTPAKTKKKEQKGVPPGNNGTPLNGTPTAIAKKAPVNEPPEPTALFPALMLSQKTPRAKDSANEGTETQVSRSSLVPCSLVPSNLVRVRVCTHGS